MMSQSKQAVVGNSPPAGTMSPHERYSFLKKEIVRRLFAGCVTKDGKTVMVRPLTVAERDIVFALEAERLEIGRRFGFR